jgi:hypothetical protein
LPFETIKLPLPPASLGVRIEPAQSKEHIDRGDVVLGGKRPFRRLAHAFDQRDAILPAHFARIPPMIGPGSCSRAPPELRPKRRMATRAGAGYEGNGRGRYPFGRPLSISVFLNRFDTNID